MPFIVSAVSIKSYDYYHQLHMVLLMSDWLERLEKLNISNSVSKSD
jgi:hypothetical protein